MKDEEPKICNCTFCGETLALKEVCSCLTKHVKVLHINHMSDREREEITRLILENTVSY